MESRESLIAYELAKQACLIAKDIQNQLIIGDEFQKFDKTPVTIADYAIQAMITKILRKSFPSDTIIAEETPDALAQPDNHRFLNNITNHLKPIFPEITKEEVIDLLGHSKKDIKGIDRYWVLDPIDGTKGFLRGEQYAIALALVNNGETTMGILGCPNYETDGSIYFTEKGHGSKVICLKDGSTQQLKMAALSDTSKIVLCTSYESSHNDAIKTNILLDKLKITANPIKSDGQGKYGLVASGKAHLFLRIPKDNSYREKIWDHRAGELLVREAGGVVTDIHGRDLECKEGHSFRDSVGVLACHPSLHEKILASLMN
ncbi:MAG: inositol monophosphatase family protein [Chlamydiota bacterium]